MGTFDKARGREHHPAQVPVTIDVQPPLLAGGALRQQLAAESVAHIASSLMVAGQGAASAAGDAGLVGALNAVADEGAGVLGGLKATIGGLATNLEAAGQAYTTADASSMGRRETGG